MKCCHFIILTYVDQQLLLPFGAFFSLYTSTRHIEVRESPDVVMTYNYPSFLVCITLW